MDQSRLADPEPGFHGYRPLLTTTADYVRFLAHVLRLDDARWQPLWPIDDGLPGAQAGASNSVHLLTDGNGG